MNVVVSSDPVTPVGMASRNDQRADRFSRIGQLDVESGILQHEGLARTRRSGLHDGSSAGREGQCAAVEEAGLRQWSLLRALGGFRRDPGVNGVRPARSRTHPLLKPLDR